MASVPESYTMTLPHRRSKLLDGVASAVGLLSFWHVRLIGELYAVEMLAPLLVLLLLPRRHHLLREKPANTILLLGLLWFFGQVVTDLYRATPWADLARGWAAIGVFLLLFATLLMLIRYDVRRMYLLLLGAAFGGIVQQFLQPSPYFNVEPWKFGFGPPLALLLVTLAGWRYWQKRRLSLSWLLALLALGAISFYLNARSLGSFVILSALIVWFRFTVWGRWLAGRRLSLGRLVALGCAAMLFTWGMLQAYKFAVTRGWLGERALAKYEMQATGKLGLIIGGRVEVIPAVFAVADSPILGHGSWAKDPRYREYLWLLQELGYERSDAQLEYAIEHSDLIPAHSHILQAWVWAGILGAAFWIYVCYVVARAVIRSFMHPHPLFLPAIYFGITNIWNIYFSPFGSMMRFHWAMTLTLLLLALKLANTAAAFRRPI